MKTFHLKTEQKIEKPQDELFSFFSDAHNLAEITPPWLHFRVLTPPPIEMKVGSRIDYRLKLRGIPIRWQSEITAWNPPHAFVDEQRRGPIGAGFIHIPSCQSPTARWLGTRLSTQLSTQSSAAGLSKSSSSPRT